MVTTAQLVEDFFGRDPLRGEDAYLELVRQHGAGAVEILIPLQGVPHARTIQITARLKSLAERLGPSIVPYLARVIAEGAWPAKLAASSCFAAFDDRPEIEAPLLKVLEEGGNFDAERIAIEALTYLGADGWAWDLVQYAKHGSWRARDLSAHFLASEFITRHELPELLQYADEVRGVQILWVLLDDCLWEVSALADYQGENADQPRTLLSVGEQSRAIKKTCMRIRDLLANA